MRKISTILPLLFWFSVFTNQLTAQVYFHWAKNMYLMDVETNNNGFVAGLTEVAANDSINLYTDNNPYWVKAQGYGGPVIVIYDSLGAVYNGFSIGKNTSSTDWQVWEMKMDDLNNVYITGYIYGSADVDPGPGIHNFSSNRYDSFVAKYDINGNLIWLYQTTTNPLTVNGQNGSYGELQVSSQGDVYLWMSFRDTMDVDPSGNVVMVYPPVPTFDNELIIRIGHSGEYIGHALPFHTTTVNDMTINHVHAKAATNGGLFITGSFTGTVDFDFGGGTMNETANGTDMYFLKLGPDLSYSWHQIFSGSGTASPGLIKTDPSGNIYMRGSFSGTMEFNPWSPGSPLTSATTTSFVSKYTSIGDMVYVLSGVNAPSLGLDNAGMWSFSNFINPFQADILTSSTMLTTTGDYDVAVCRYSTDLNLEYAGQITGSNKEYVDIYDVSSNGHAVVKGYTKSSDSDVDPTSGSHTIPLVGSQSYYVVKLARWPSTLSTNDPEGSVQFSIYPNPASNAWNILSESELIDTYELYSISGELIYQGNTNGAYVFSLDATCLDSGIYLLTVTTGSGKQAVKKIIKE